ncbi:MULTISPECIES: hypothetical protein [Romboutsia]|jgi:DNA-binding transcriptional ArsR family regulator|uniref:hypothetical protein n=1 Tax=Romboutsia TaxID=1501226 RepID=UPI002582781D|nr:MULTISPECIES: hypothetical protein [Romboutsia]
MNNIDFIFKALSDPIRIKILKKLYSAESVYVCDLTLKFTTIFLYIITLINFYLIYIFNCSKTIFILDKV